MRRSTRKPSSPEVEALKTRLVENAAARTNARHSLRDAVQVIAECDAAEKRMIDELADAMVRPGA